MCLLFAGFVPGTTAVRKTHQIPVDSLVDYLQKELGLHQGGSEKKNLHLIDCFEHCMIMSLENCFICTCWVNINYQVSLKNLHNHLIITVLQEYILSCSYSCKIL